MSGYYWVKLYTEIINDPKMATLPDRLWRRIVELFAIAGDFRQDGRIPETRQLAWILRMNPDDLELDLQQIASIGIIDKTIDGWMVTHFKERQAPASGAQRMERLRENKQKQQYYGNGDETVTKRHVEVDTESDKSRVEQIKPAVSSAEISQAKSQYMEQATQADAHRMLLTVSKYAALPSDQLRNVETVQAMIIAHGEEKTKEALTRAREKWIHTQGKNGKNYSPLNISGWVGWALDNVTNKETAGSASFSPAYDAMMAELRGARNEQ
jgi:hypothetical protein